MANTKISALTSATTPLAGTEVLPIVQSGATVKVANNDLRPKQIQSNATSGVLQIAGPSAGTTRTMTTPDANFTAARTDAANSFIGDQTLSTGNLIQGTAAKGVNFTANTGAAGKTSQLLNWYEEGTWTPTLGGSTADPTGVTYVAQTGRYTRVGRTVTVSGLLGFTTYTGGTGNAIVRGLPFTVNATISSIGGVLLEQITISAGYTSVTSRATSGTAYVDVMQVGTAANWIPLPIGNAASSATGKYIQFTVTYEV